MKRALFYLDNYLNMNWRHFVKFIQHFDQALLLSFVDNIKLYTYL